MPPRHASRFASPPKSPVVVLVAALWLMAVSPQALGQGPAGQGAGEYQPAKERTVRLTSPDCAAAPMALEAFLASLRVELAGTGLRCCETGGPDDPITPDEVRLALAPCDPSGAEVAVALDGATAAGTVKRRVPMADVLPAARPRTLALAVAELVRGARQPPVPERPAPVPPAPVAFASEPNPAPELSLGPWATGELRFHPHRNTTLWGGRLGLRAGRGRWQGALDLHGASGSRGTELGEIDVGLLGLGLEAGPRLSAGPVRVEVGPAAEIGWAWVAGRTDRPDVQVASGSGLTATVGGRIGVEAPARSALRVRIHLEGGAVLRGVTGDLNGTPAAGATGGYLLFGLGAAFVDRS